LRSQGNQDRTGWRISGAIEPRSLWLLALLAAAAAGAYFAAARLGMLPPLRAPRCERCNVILVTFDALRADHLGIYGYGRDVSPEVDAFGRRSSVFTRCISQSGSTASSIPSIHTGKYPNTDRILRRITLRENERTLAEILREAGYATSAVIAHKFAGCKWGVCRGFDVIDEDYQAPEAAGETAARLLRRLRAQEEEPFFLWAHLRHPHFPYDPPESVFRALYEGDETTPTFYSKRLARLRFRGQLGYLVSHFEAQGEPVTPYEIKGKMATATPSIIEQLVAMYDGTIREGDRVFGALTGFLAESGLAERTIVVVAADHAESMGEHGVFGHNHLWYGVLHTPLIVHVPGAAHRVLDRPVMNVDILPTILSVLGLEVPADIRGVSVFARPRRQEIQYAEYSGAQTVVRGDFKLIVGHTARAGTESQAAQLFNIADDPAEQVDLAASQPEIVRELEAIVARIRATSLAHDPDTPDSAVLENLRALGYIE
jgi:arylsulfatase A-like enzyme